MATQFMALTNRLLRRLNEVTIAQSDFASVRGVQSMAKDAIVASVQSINSREYEWPFNSAEGTQLLTVGQQDYDFPNDLKVVKWDSFRLDTNDSLGVTARTLQLISRDEWYQYFREEDIDAGVSGISVPLFVFERHGWGFAVSPSPDKAYSIKFDYFTNAVDPITYDDTTTIPSQFDEIIVQGALYHFYMFRDNAQQASMAEERFENMISDMRSILINKEDRVRSGMIVQPRHYGTPTFKVY